MITAGTITPIRHHSTLYFTQISQICEIIIQTPQISELALAILPCDFPRYLPLPAQIPVSPRIKFVSAEKRIEIRAVVIAAAAEIIGVGRVLPSPPAFGVSELGEELAWGIPAVRLITS